MLRTHIVADGICAFYEPFPCHVGTLSTTPPACATYVHSHSMTQPPHGAGLFLPTFPFVLLLPRSDAHPGRPREWDVVLSVLHTPGVNNTVSVGVCGRPWVAVSSGFVSPPRQLRVIVVKSRRTQPRLNPAAVPRRVTKGLLIIQNVKYKNKHIVNHLGQ